MYELNVTTKKQLERATSRAQAQKPKIEEIAFGMYKVWSSNPETPWLTYSTGIEVAPDGSGYSVCCSCPTQNYFCKHVSAVFPHFLMRVKEQEATQPAAPAEDPAILYADLIPSFDDEAQSQLPPVEEARAQAEQALAALVVCGVLTTSEQEIERLIDQAKEESESMDRECPQCGVTQPDDDSADCFACRAILDPQDEDEDPEPDPDPAVCACGKPGFSYFNGEWHCISCIKDMAAKKELACKDCGAPATSGEGRCDACQMAKDSADLFGTPYLVPPLVLPFVRSVRVKEEW